MSSVDLTNELRLAKPRAPEQLRERVMALSERPVREPRFSFSLPSRYTARRVALVAVPAVVAVAVGGAVIHGIANSGAPTACRPLAAGRLSRRDASDLRTLLRGRAPRPARLGTGAALRTASRWRKRRCHRCARCLRTRPACSTTRRR